MVHLNVNKSLQNWFETNLRKSLEMNLQFYRCLILIDMQVKQTLASICPAHEQNPHLSYFKLPVTLILAKPNTENMRFV